MSTILDIIGGTVIAGMIILLTITATDIGTREFFNYNSDAIVQNQLMAMSEIIEFDLRKMGFGIPEAQKDDILQIAKRDHLKFLAHLNLERDFFEKEHGNLHKDAIPDTIEYKIVPDDSVDYKDTVIVIYKVIRSLKISGESERTSMIGKIANRDVFRYLDQIGREVDIIQATKMVEVSLIALNPRVVLSPELVGSKVDDSAGAELRKRELRRLLRASFWRQTRLVSRNLRR